VCVCVCVYVCVCDREDVALFSSLCTLPHLLLAEHFRVHFLGLFFAQFDFLFRLQSEMESRHMLQSEIESNPSIKKIT